MVYAAVFKKNLISALRGEYIDFVISRVTAAVFTIATAQILYGLHGGQTSESFASVTGAVDYRAYIIVGAALAAVTQSIFLNVSRILMTELRDGTIEAVFLAPFPRWQYYFGSQFAQMLLTSVDILFSLLFAVLLHIEFDLNGGLLLTGMVLLYASLFGIACFTSLLMIYLRDTFFIQNTILPLIILCSGYVFPVQMFPAPLAGFFSMLPLQRAIQLIRGGLLGSPVQVLGSDVLFLLFALVLSSAGLAVLPGLERYAIERHLS